jgi:hypothetical protein
VERECEAWACGQPAKHYTTNAASGRGFHLCYHHMSYHTAGIGFDLEPAKPAEALLTGSGPTAILELPAHTIVALPAGGTITLKETHMSHGILSTLTDARSELEDGINGARDRIQELEEAINDMESALENVTEAIDALENIDGFSASVDVDSLSIDVSIYF